jgi:hypothetical protein
MQLLQSAAAAVVAAHLGDRLQHAADAHANTSGSSTLHSSTTANQQYSVW